MGWVATNRLRMVWLFIAAHKACLVLPASATICLSVTISITCCIMPIVASTGMATNEVTPCSTSSQGQRLIYQTQLYGLLCAGFGTTYPDHFFNQGPFFQSQAKGTTDQPYSNYG